MKTINIQSYLNTELFPWGGSIQTIEIEDKPISEGAFGSVYKCISINQQSLLNELVVKIFKEDANHKQDHNFLTVQKLQKKVKEENSKINNRFLNVYVALKGIPQISFEGILNNKPCRGFTSLNLKSLGFEEFIDILQDKNKLINYQKLNLKQKIQISFHFVKAFTFLHKISFIHADLKPEAIFINTQTLECAIIDFDSGVITENPNDEPNVWGTPNDWLAPEIWQQLKNNQSQKVKVNLLTDLWSVCIGVHYLLTTTHPLFYLTELSPRVTIPYFSKYKWPEIQSNEIFFNQKNSKIYNTYYDWIKNKLPPSIFKLIANTINFGYENPTKRTTYNEWFNALNNFPLIHHFNLSQNTIPIGNEIELDWKVDNAKKLELYFDSNTIDVTHKTSYKHKPKQNTTYTLKAIASDNHNYVEQPVKVTVIQRPEIVQFTATKSKLLEGEELQLSWSVKNTSEIELKDPNHQSIPILTYGFFQRIPNNKKISNPKEGYYRLIAKNKYFTIEERLEIKIYPKPEVLSLVANPTKIGIGYNTKIEWVIQHAHSAKLLFNGNSLDIALKSSFTATPKQKTTYTLEILALDEKTVFQENIEVEVVPKPVIKTFTASTVHVMETLPIRFYWDVEHAESIKIYSPEGQETEVTHLTEIELPAQKSGKYTLKVKNEFFDNAATIYVHVNELPKIELKVPTFQNFQLPSFDMKLDSLQNQAFQSIEDEFQEFVSTPRKNTLGWLDFVKKLLKI